MDIRREAWWGSCHFNGKSLELSRDIKTKGSIMGIIAESLKSLTTEKSRYTSDGESEIVIRIRNKPLDSSREGIAQLEKASEVESLIETTSDQPLDGETYEQFHDRLVESGYPTTSAMVVAAEWFEREVDGGIIQWLSDPKAIRFRELNSRNEAYENALPNEYESLKHYVVTEFPTFVEHITFRTA